MARRATGSYEAQHVVSQLIENARGYAEKVSSELKKNDPGYAIAFLGLALELLLKARLCHEHWALVIKDLDAKKATWESFSAGRAVTVSGKEAIKRLSGLVGIRFSENSTSLMNEVFELRNQAIHFSVNLATADGSPKDVEERIRLVCLRACYQLTVVLRSMQFQAQFENDLDLFRSSIHREFRKIKNFTDVAFVEAEQHGVLAAHRSRYSIVDNCPICGKRARGHEVSDLGYIHRCHCCICDSRSTLVAIPCSKIIRGSDCEGNYYIDEYGTSNCTKCDSELLWGPNEIAWNLVGFDEDRHKERYVSEYVGFCSECGNDAEATVAQILESEPPLCICLRCAEVYHEFMRQCECCGEVVAGLDDGSGFSGCVLCGGLDYPEHD